MEVTWPLFPQCDSTADWRVNGAGFHHSHQHGFGLLSAWRLVNAAKVRGDTQRPVLLVKWGQMTAEEPVVFQIWETVPFLVSYQSSVMKEQTAIPASPTELVRTWTGEHLNPPLVSDSVLSSSNSVPPPPSPSSIWLSILGHPL